MHIPAALCAKSLKPHKSPNSVQEILAFSTAGSFIYNHYNEIATYLYGSGLWNQGKGKGGF